MWGDQPGSNVKHVLLLARKGGHGARKGGHGAWKGGHGARKWGHHGGRKRDTALLQGALLCEGQPLCEHGGGGLSEKDA